jgi:hypothetical protein
LRNVSVRERTPPVKERFCNKTWDEIRQRVVALATERN